MGRWIVDENPEINPRWKSNYELKMDSILNKVRNKGNLFLINLEMKRND